MATVSSSSQSKLEIGSGNRPTKGYVHLDVKDFGDDKTDIIWDATKTPYPFKNEEFSEIYSHWVLEHFALRDLKRIILEWKRLLCPGGKIIAITNNQEAHNKCLAKGEITWKEWVRLTYGIKENKEFTKLGLPIPKEVSVFECHKIGFCEENVKEIFERCGFKVEIKTIWKCRELDGTIKCPGIIIKAVK